MKLQELDSNFVLVPFDNSPNSSELIVSTMSRYFYNVNPRLCHFNATSTYTIYLVQHPITITITKSGTSAWPPVPPLSSFSLSFFSIGTLQFRRQEDIDVDDDIDIDIDDDDDHSDQSVDGDQVRKIISMIATNPRMQQMVRDDQ